MTERQKNAMRDEHYNALHATRASLQMFQAQIRLARVQLIRNQEVDISLAVGDKAIHCAITRSSHDATELLVLIGDYVSGQIQRTDQAIEEMKAAFPDLPKDRTQYPNAIVLNPFQVPPPKRRKRGLKAIFFTIRTLPIWLLSGKRPVS
jgi:hypothetical protein